MKHSRRTRRPAALALTAALTAVSAGCAPPGLACPAIGWVNVLEVTVASSPVEVAHVEVCAADKCASSAPTPTFDGTEVLFFSGAVNGTWSFEDLMQTPGAASVRFLDAAGALIAEREVALVWQSDADHGPCGGPGTARVSVDL